jgi:hypothetical protein
MVDLALMVAWLRKGPEAVLFWCRSGRKFRFRPGFLAWQSRNVPPISADNSPMKAQITVLSRIFSDP